MFCNHCGAILPDDSKFCLKCGKELTVFARLGSHEHSRRPAHFSGTGETAATPAPAQAPVIVHVHEKPKRGGALVVLLLLLGLIIWWAASSNSPGAQQFRRSIQREQPIANQTVAVAAMSFVSVQFQVPPASTNPTVTGEFNAAGGAGNDVEVYVVSEQDFVNWQNHHAARAFYSSGRLTRGTITAQLPGAGTYYLVVSNSFSLLSPKNVAINAMLHY